MAMQMSRSSPFSVVSVVTLRLFHLLDRDFSQFTGAYFVKDSANLLYTRLDIGPCRGQQDDNRQSLIYEVLLVSHILVSGDEDFVSLLLGLLD